MLLRVLQERVIERVGGDEPIAGGRARDRRHPPRPGRRPSARAGSGPTCSIRLNVFPIRVPPLRERREDIPDLVRHFLAPLRPPHEQAGRAASAPPRCGC